MKALTREVSPGLTRCELTFLARAPIDVDRAIVQHDAYCRALSDLGLEVVRLPADPGMPDGVFVEDAAVVVDEVAVIAAMGAASRRGETAAVAGALAADRALVRLDPPARLDGGDVLVIGRRVFVGRSRRTDDAGARGLASALAPFGYTIVPVDVTGCLHLKSAVTALDEATVLVNREWIDPAPFDGLEQVDVDASEPWAANVLTVAGVVFAHAGFRRTAGRLASRGYDVRPLDVSEFLKAEAGVTCKSIVYRA